MPTIVRPNDEKPRKRRNKCGMQNPECGKKTEVQKSAADEAVTERTLWHLRQQIAGCLQRIDELETMVYKLAYGGKEKEYYTVEETAEIWGMSKSALYLMIRDGRLPAVKIGEALRISKATILRGTK